MKKILAVSAVVLSVSMSGISWAANTSPTPTGPSANTPLHPTMGSSLHFIVTIPTASSCANVVKWAIAYPLFTRWAKSTNTWMCPNTRNRQLN